MKNKDLINFFEKKRKDFPILFQKINSHNLVYVDNAATTQKPRVVIDAISNFYLKDNSNVHRGVHTLSEISTSKYESVRKKIQNFISAESEKEIVFTSGTTDSINKVAFGLIKEIKKDDEIILSVGEHHANLVCWQEISKLTGAKLRFIDLNKEFKIDIVSLENIISNKTKVIAISHCSNVLGSINDVSKISQLAKKFNSYVILDAAQSISHMKIDVQKLGIDFMVFSSHKMMGPTGVGVLWGRKEALEKLSPISFGGGMIYHVELENSTYGDLPQRLEAGTPNIADVIGFGYAIDYLMEIKMDYIEKYEKLLTKHFLKRILEVENLQLFGSTKLENRASVFSFNISKLHPHDVSSILDKFGIAIRGGHHCAMPLAKILGVNSTSRISFSFYNTLEEVDYIIECLKKVEFEFEKGSFILN